MITELLTFLISNLTPEILHVFQVSLRVLRYGQSGPPFKSP
jgi:hypothetical protein